MKKMELSKLEATITKHRVFICLVWIIVASIYVYLFTVHWIIGGLFLCFFPLFLIMTCQEKFYIPFSRDYFHLIKTKEAREAINKQFDSFKYIQIDEMCFLEDFILFSKWGALFNYDEVAFLDYKKTIIGRGSFQRPAYVLTLQLKTKKNYCLTIDGVDELGIVTLYQKALQYMASKANTE